MPKTKRVWTSGGAKLQHKGIWIGILVTLAFTSLNIINYCNVHNVSEVLQMEEAYITQKNMEQEDALKAKIIYGYVIGYLSSTKRQFLTRELTDFVNLTVKYAREFDINPYQCLSICQIENGFDLHKVGSHGEQGPAQLMPGTWRLYYKSFGYRLNDFYKWKFNYRVAMAHFAELLRQNHDDVAEAIGEYNGGGQWAGIESSRNYVERFKFANRGISKLY
jgi:soluble lytic murein transglycosylase-like protein